MFRKQPETTHLDEVIDNVRSQMVQFDAHSEEHITMTKQLDSLYKMKASSQNRVSADNLVVAGVNISGILLILHYERLHVVTSKALGFITKLRF